VFLLGPFLDEPRQALRHYIKIVDFILPLKMSKDIYRLDLEGSDSECGHIALWDSQRYLPRADCASCGEKGVGTDRWFPSWDISTKIIKNSPPTENDLDRVLSAEDFPISIASHVTGLTEGQTVLPGTFIGSRPIVVPRKALLSILNCKHVRNGQPMIGCGMSKMFSAPAAEILSLDNTAVLTRVALHVESTEVPYFVFEGRILQVWSDEMWGEHGLQICPTCGTFSFKKRPKTYAIKHFRRDIFENGPVVVQSRENNNVLVNSEMKCLLEASVDRLCFKVCGSY
jgi:hypothetical protein